MVKGFNGISTHPPVYVDEAARQCSVSFYYTFVNCVHLSKTYSYRTESQCKAKSDATLNRIYSHHFNRMRNGTMVDFNFTGNPCVTEWPIHHGVISIHRHYENEYVHSIWFIFMLTIEFSDKTMYYSRRIQISTLKV